MKEHFIKVATVVPKVRVADCDFNTSEIIRCTNTAAAMKVQIIVFPELSITGYSCGDLFFQETLLDSAIESIYRIIDATANQDIIVIIGMPLATEDMVLNVAVAIQKGRILGVVPKSYLPNYKEFQEKRWFASAFEYSNKDIILCRQHVPIGNDLVFCTPTGKFSIELCEDLWAPIPPSSYLSMNGADIIFNLSASNECSGKYDYLHSLLANQSARTISGYVYSSCGFGESTTDVVFAGNGFIYENGKLLKQTKRFSIEEQIIVADINIASLHHERRVNNTFSDCSHNSMTWKARNITTGQLPSVSHHTSVNISAHPFLPHEKIAYERYEEIINIQTMGLAKRLVHTGLNHVIIGVSGGLDSTLALLICKRAFDKLQLKPCGIIGVSMPGFGTTSKTCKNAECLMMALGVTIRHIDIKSVCLQHFKDIGHPQEEYDIVFENAQARERTQILMDVANQTNGMVIGTGDMSELALGWATFAGDHISMYDINCGVPKTLVKHMVNHFANKTGDPNVQNILTNILHTPISPELLPIGENDTIVQQTEDIIGPYELHDFFLFHMLRYGANPGDILEYALTAFKDMYDKQSIKKWLKVFLNRFFAQQFKRSCMPDGPKVGSVALSPRGDWRMPSDANVSVWVKDLDDID